MDLITKTYIRPSQKVSTIVKDNPILLLVLENFGVSRIGKDLTVSQLCKTMGLNVNLFLMICNLHNGFYIEKVKKVNPSDIPAIINYLSQGHRYYLKEKYPEIRGFIKRIGKSAKSNFMLVMESYFDEYFREVKEHILYEEKIAFPTLIIKKYID